MKQINTKYNQLREAIQKAEPDIMRLEFGCRVLLDDDEGGKVETRIIQKCKGDDNEVIFQFLPSRNWKIEDVEIIGRDITATDILKTLHCHSEFYFINTAGQFLKSIGSKREYEETDVWWNFNKPLQNQSKEVHNLLWDLICNK